MTIERSEPSRTADERTMLEGWLEYHRASLAVKCQGLTDEQLRTASVAPSALTLLGLVRHMADVERGWFRRVLAGEDAAPIHYTAEDRDGDFRVTETDTWQDAYATWQNEITVARRHASGFALDDLAKGHHHSTDDPFNLRWIYTHMIEEYARHNGHADLLRESIDGVTGD
ncbi:DinB family protein [Streptomyces sp. NPDC059477]|uniref:DinB family protein n=1 Tax=Streptomyces sp. NPDC059477 TaxID=3346847 RepID=UPI0036BC4232